MYKKKVKSCAGPTIIKVTIKKIEKPVDTAKVAALPTINKSRLWERSQKVLKELKKIPVIKKQQPLVIGISKTLQELYPQIPKRLINTAMYIHTHSKNYLKNLSSGQPRVYLDGTVAQSVDSYGMNQAKFILKSFRRRSKGVQSTHSCHSQR